jgi:tetratricopeptide (TPR) repeat protein
MTLLDFREEIQKFKAINLEVLEESISDLTDDIKNSIVLYNKAIESIEKGSEDIAIIELKKAVSINPNFHEALNLLGLCYAYTGEKDKAADIFEQVIESERNGIRAYVYRKQFGGELPEMLQSLISGQEIHEDKAGKTPSKKADAKRIPVKKVQVSTEAVLYSDKKPSPGKSVLKFGIGFLTGVLIMFMAAYIYSSLYPSSGEDNTLTNENEIIALEEDKAMLQRELNNAESRYKELEGRYNSLTGELEQANGRIDYLTGLRKLMNIGLLEMENKIEEAADSLLEINYDSLELPEKTWYDALQVKIMPEAANIVYNEGRDLCQRELNYEKGLEKLRKVLLYDENFGQQEALFYYTGKCYQGVGDYEKAMEYYNRVLTEYPGGYYSQYVGIRIAEINAATARNQ